MGPTTMMLLTMKGSCILMFLATPSRAMKGNEESQSGNEENLSPAGGRGGYGSAPSRPEPIWKTATIFSNDSLNAEFDPPSWRQTSPRGSKTRKHPRFELHPSNESLNEVSNGRGHRDNFMLKVAEAEEEEASSLSQCSLTGREIGW